MVATCLCILWFLDFWCLRTVSPESQAGVKFQDHLFAVATHFLVLCSFLKQPAGPNFKGFHDRKQSLLSSTQRRMCPSGCGGLICRGMENRYLKWSLNVILLGKYRNCCWRSVPWMEYILKLPRIGGPKLSLWSLWNLHIGKTKRNEDFYGFLRNHHWTCAYFSFGSAAILHIFPSSRSRCTGITSGQPWHWRVVRNLAAPAVRIAVLRMSQVPWKNKVWACWKLRKWRKPLRKAWNL